MEDKIKDDVYCYKKQCDLIKKNIRGRQLALRWKSVEFEKALLEQTGLKASKYVTRNFSRVNERDSFLDTEILGKSDKYYLVITENLAWNRVDFDRYFGGGYKEIQDMLWIRPCPKTVRLCNGLDHYEDDYGNVIDSKSDVIVKFTGYDSKIYIGINVKMPKREITVGRQVMLDIDDNSSMINATLNFGMGTKLTVGKSVGMGTMNVFINHFSTVEIGDKTTLQSGKLRTGRNQKVKIGKDCMFSWDIVFLPHDGHLIYDLNKARFTNNTNGTQRESVVIGDHVWIGGETVLMPNTRIGSGSICGYRSMLKGEYPNNCILAGMPAKVIRKDIAWIRSNFAEDDKEILLLDEEYRKSTEYNPQKQKQ